MPEAGRPARLSESHSLFLHDIEGHGASEPPARFSGIRALTRRISEVIRDQGLLDGRPLIGMGHSFGAALTLRLAALHPGLFKAVVLLDPIVLPAPIWAVWRALGQVGFNPMARAARARRQSWPSRDEARERLRGCGIFVGWTEEALQCFVDHALTEEGGEIRLCCPPELEAQIYERPIFPWIAVRRAHLPILFLHGAQSYGFLSGAARIARRVNPQVTTATVPGRHCFMLEHPADAHRAVADFLHKALA